MKKIISLGMILILMLFAGQAFAQSARLNNKIALVTGAASGNGKAIATLFAQEKAKVVLVDINKVTLNEAVTSLSKQGYDVIGVEADVTKEADIQKMVDAALSKYGRLDILVNNAGIFDELIPVGEVSDDLWYKVMETNLNAPMRGIRKVIPIFEKQGGGVIVNTASIAGFTGARGGGAAYVASKHALIGLTKNVAFNYKEKNIRCNAVAPGRVETNLRINSEKLAGSKTARDQSIGKWKDIEDKITEGYITNMRKCTPDEIAKVALFRGRWWLDIILIDCEYMKHLINYLVSRNSFSGNFYSFVILNFRSFCGLMMLPYGYGKIVNYDRYAADFFGNPICIGNIPSLWLTIFAQTICPIMLIVGFQTRLAASILAFNMLIAVKFHFFDSFNIKVLPTLFLGLYLIQLLLGAGKYSLDYFLFSKIKIRISKNETKGILLYLVICGISWFVLANYFTGLVSVCLIVLAITLYLLSLYYIKDNEL